MCSHHGEGNALEVMPYHLMCTSEGEDGTPTYYYCFDPLVHDGSDTSHMHVYHYLVGCYDNQPNSDTHEKAHESAKVVHSLINHTFSHY